MGKINEPAMMESAGSFTNRAYVEIPTLTLVSQAMFNGKICNVNPGLINPVYGCD